MSQHCLYVKKLRKLCIEIDKKGPISPWVFKGICELKYEDNLPNSHI